MNTEHARRRHFHQELDTLQERLLEMATLVEHALADATRAVLDRDPTQGDILRDADERIDELEVEIDERVVELLALQQPMASDLRQIIATNKVSNDLERIADHAVNIARAVARLADAPPMEKLREIEEMIELTRGMVSDALAAYVSRNAGTARMVCLTDDRVDDLKRSVFRIVVTHMLEDPKRIGAALELLLISQNLERTADLATNICEDVVFLVEGRSIKHGLDIDEDDDETEHR
ncbi:MAG: phosphate signaling complex protein PhoU [Gemmatimonadetes bacterium]|nr:phosphate signaling complex protein PhoU [Gemmatimonadota bacterium]NNL29490.1 phosphate signaling complex protein PhoU [Gemmatimonadota bacterium]